METKGENDKNLLATDIACIHMNHKNTYGTVEPRYNEVLWTMKITLLYQVSHYIRVKKKEI